MDKQLLIYKQCIWQFVHKQDQTVDPLLWERKHLQKFFTYVRIQNDKMWGLWRQIHNLGFLCTAPGWTVRLGAKYKELEGKLWKGKQKSSWDFHCLGRPTPVKSKLDVSRSKTDPECRILVVVNSHCNLQPIVCRSSNSGCRWKFKSSIRRSLL